MADRLRLDSLDEIGRREMDSNQHERLGKVFAGVVASPLHSPIIRQRVLHLIIEHYHTKAPQWLGAALTNTIEQQLRREIIDLLVKLDDKKSLPYLILTLAESDKETDDDRAAITHAIESIGKEPVDKVLLECLADNNGRLKTRMAALSSMLEHKSRPEVIADIIALKSDGAFLDELRFWAGRFGYVPGNMMRFFICRVQRSTLTNTQLERLHRNVLLLGRGENYTFDVRDSYLLLFIGDGRLGLGRVRMIERILGRLAKLEHTKRPASYPGGPDDYAEDFVDQYKHLSYTDLLSIDLLLDSLAGPEAIGQIRSYLRRDFIDVTTETGGLCFIERGRVVFREYPPGRRLGDNQYIESPETLWQGGFCLARWHCHTDRWRTVELAGPGTDDLRYGAWVNCPVVVLTRLGDKACNVDYFTPEGVVIDLGNY